MRVLIVDDESVKAREIIALTDERRIEFETVSSSNEALRYFKKKKYDLLILDIMLPQDERTVDISKSGGIELIKSIQSLQNIYIPREIICISSEKSIVTKYEAELKKYLIPILHYKQDEDEWKELIVNRIKHINTSLKDEIKIDIAIITATTDEYDAVVREFKPDSLLPVLDDSGSYKIGTMKCDEEDKLILVTQLPEMGMPAASNTVTKLIMRFNPDKLFMVGICGGVKGKVELGDVIIASSSWDYGNGKITPNTDDEKTYYKFEAEPHQIGAETGTISLMRDHANGILREVENEWNAKNENDMISSKIHISPLPSGASVIADDKLFNEIIKPQHRKCVGLDMETYGFYYAVKNTYNRNYEFLSIKSVSDFADSDKNDDYHKKCCFISARFLRKCLEKGIL